MPIDPEIKYLISIFIGLIIVISYGFTSFNLPLYRLDNDNLEHDGIDKLIELGGISPKTLSSKGRYLLFNLLYIVFLIILYALACLLWDEQFEVLLGLPSLKDAPITPLLIAFVLTGVVNTPLFNKLFTNVKVWLHTKAQIPSKARHIFYLIKTNPIKNDCLEAAMTSEENPLRETFHNVDVITDVLSFERLWVRYMHLYGEVNRNTSQLLLNMPINEPFSYHIIKQCHENILVGLTTLQQIDNPDFSDIKIQVLTQLKRINALLAYSLLKSKSSESDIKEVLQSMGFEILHEGTPKFNDINRVITHTGRLLLTVALSAAFFTLCHSIYPDFSPSSFKHPLTGAVLAEGEIILLWTIYSLSMVAPAFLCTYYSRFWFNKKGKWKERTYVEYRKSPNERPWSLYLWTSLIAYSFSAFFFRVTEAFLNRSITEAEFWLWPSVTAVITIFVCYRFDSLKPNLVTDVCHEPKWRTSLLQGGILVVLSAIIMNIVEASSPGKYVLYDDYILILSTTFLVGFFNSLTMKHHNAEQRTGRRYMQKTTSENNEYITFSQSDQQIKAQIIDVSESGLKLNIPNIMSFSKNAPIEVFYTIGNFKYRIHARIINHINFTLRVKIEKKSSWNEILQHLKQKFNTQVPLPMLTA